MEHIKCNPTLYIDDNPEEDLTTSIVSEEDPANRFISSIVVSDNPELDRIKRRVKEVELQAEAFKNERDRLFGGQTRLDTVIEHPMNEQEGYVNATPMFHPFSDNADHRSVYVGNVDYEVTHNQLGEHFAGCGPVLRATIPKNRADNNHPKGYGYVEFGDVEAMRAALKLNETVLNGRVINVLPKRANRPGMSQTNRIPRGTGRGGFFNGTIGRNVIAQPQLELQHQIPGIHQQIDPQNQQHIHQMHMQQQQQQHLQQQQQLQQPIYSLYQPGL